MPAPAQRNTAHRWISPSKVPEVQAQLAHAGPNAVALVIYAFRSDPR